MNNYKKAVIVTLFDNYSYNVRTRYVEKILKDRGYTIDFFVADFDHREKKKYAFYRQNIKLIKVPKYKKNMSFKRIYSHYIYSKKIVGELQSINPQLIYVITPPNMLFHALSKYYKMTKCILIYDIYDLWPESLPLKNNIKKRLNLFLNSWKNIRDRNIYNCDGVIYECELFEKLLAIKSKSIVTKTIYLTKNIPFDEINVTIYSNILKLAYIGSINNIIDIYLIKEIIAKLSLNIKVEIHIIGSGESKSDLIESLNSINNVSVKDYGIIYDEKNKYRIISQCDFGINIMKNEVCVGLTMKSIDYLSFGLPIINNIPFDTWNIVNKYKCGINIDSSDLDKKILEILKIKTEKNTMISYHNNSFSAYKSLFSVTSFEKSFTYFLNDIIATRYKKTGEKND